MDWETWDKTYPAQVVDKETKHYLGKEKTRPEIENFKDNYEEENEHGGLIVVKFGDYFYCIYNPENHVV